MTAPERLARLNDYIDQWAKTRPGHPAMVQHEDDKIITYKKFAELIDFFALRLMDMGIGKGDRVATQLVLVPEHMILMYACFKIGAVFAPLDVRLTETEVVRDVNKINPKAFFFLGNTPVKDFREVGRAVQQDCPSVNHLVQFTPDPKPGELLGGDMGYFKPMDGYRALYLSGRQKFVIKQKGYNVFPVEVEEHIAAMAGVEIAEVVGMKHKLFDEGIFAFVRPEAGVEMVPEEVMTHCKAIAAYKRPAHVEIWPSDEEFPLTRSTKVDKIGLMERAEAIVADLRSKGLWGAGQE